MCSLIAAGSLKGTFDENQFMPFPIPAELRQQSDAEVESIMSGVLAAAKKKQKPGKKSPKVKKANGDHRKP